MAAPYDGPPYGQPPPAAPAAPAASPAQETDEQWANRIKQKAAAEGWSEDFARYTPEQMAPWRKFWDEGRGRFRSQHAPKDAGDWAYVEKPTESVIDPATGNEWGPWGNKIGVNLSEIPRSQGGKGEEVGGGAGAAAGGQTTIPGLGGYSLTSPAQTGGTPEEVRLADLQRVLEDKFLNRQGMFGFASGRQGQGPETAAAQTGQSLKGGGLWWGGKDIYDVAKPVKTPKVLPRATPGALAIPGGGPGPGKFSAPAPGVGTAPPAGPVIGGSLQDALLKRRRARIQPDWVTNPAALTPPAMGVDYGA